MDYDVVIAGGGPGGLAAAIVCGQARLRVLLLERRALPADKACGEGLMPPGVASLRRLGVLSELPPDEYRPFLGVHYIAPSGRTARADFREGPGLGIRRLALSQALLRRAQEFDSVDICTRTAMNGFSVEPGKIVVQAGAERYSARLLVGADGLRSQVRRRAGLAGPPGVRKRWGARQHFSIQPWSSAVEVHFGEGMEAYTWPCGPQRVGLSFLWDSARVRPSQGGSQVIPSLLELFPRLEKRLQGAVPASAPLAVGPLEQQVTGVTAEGVILLGDAAGYLDACTGEGISLALAQAQALARTVIPSLQAGNHRLVKRELQDYALAHARIVRAYQRTTPLVLWAGSQRWRTEAAVRLLRRSPWLFQRLLSANMGTRQSG